MIEIYRELAGFRGAGEELRERGVVHLEVVALRDEVAGDDRDAANDTVRAVHVAGDGDVEVEDGRAVGHANGGCQAGGNTVSSGLRFDLQS